MPGADGRRHYAGGHQHSRLDVPFRRHACGYDPAGRGPFRRAGQAPAPGTSSVRCWAGSGRVSIPAKPPSAICVCWTNARPTKKKPQSCWALPTPSSPPKTDSRAIADWYESYGYGPDMIAEAAAYAGEKKSVKYVQRHPARMVHQGLQNRARRNGRRRHGLEQRAGRRARRETQYSGRRAAARTARAGACRRKGKHNEQG